MGGCTDWRRAWWNSCYYRYLLNRFASTNRTLEIHDVIGSHLGDSTKVCMTSIVWTQCDDFQRLGNSFIGVHCRYRTLIPTPAIVAIVLMAGGQIRDFINRLLIPIIWICSLWREKRVINHNSAVLNKFSLKFTASFERTVFDSCGRRPDNNLLYSGVRCSRCLHYRAPCMRG